MTQRVRKAALIASFVLLLAVVYLCALGLGGTILAAVLRADFLFDRSPAFLLWIALPDVRFLYIPLLVALVPLVLVMRSMRVASGRPHTALRLFLWSGALALALLSFIGLLQNGSGLAALSRGNFELDRPPANLFGVEIDDVRWLWGGLVLAFFVLIIYLITVYKVHSAHAGRPVGEVDQPVVDLDELTDVVDSLALTQRELKVFLSMLLEPRKHIERITEIPETYTRSTVIRTRYTVAMRVRKSRVLHLPLFLSTRGRLEDGLQITVDGEPVAPVAHLRSAAYAAAVIRRCIQDAGGTALAAYQATGSKPSIEEDVLRALASSVDPASRVGAEKVDHDVAFVALATRLVLLPHVDDEPLRQAVRLLFALKDSDPIVLRLASDFDGRRRRFDIEVSRRTTPPQSDFRVRQLWEYLWLRPQSAQFASASRLLKLRDLVRRARVVTRAAFTRATDQLRHWFGVKSNIVRHELGSAGRARSYHLEMKGPSGTYAARQSLDVGIGSSLLPIVEATSSPGRGQRHVHLYVRNGDPAMDRYRFSVAFFERTPGSMAVAFVAAGSAFLLSGILALKAITPGGDDDPSGILQILLAFPVAAAAAGTLLADRTEWGGVLAARFANLITFLLSLATLWVSLLPDTFTKVALPRVWLVIVGLLAILTLACLGSWIMRSLVHSRFVSN